MSRIHAALPLASLATAALLMAPSARAAEPGPREITFAGYTWAVKASEVRVGPGPNVFSDDPTNVSVDATGALHLAVTQRDGLWQSAEVVNRTPLGYGTYTWRVDGDVTALAPQVVLGMFTWSDDPAWSNREIDIEFTRWGDSSAERSGWYAIQTGAYPTPISTSFALRRSGSSVHSFTWSPGKVRFTSKSRGRAQRWAYSGPQVPVPGDETPRINLWLYRGASPGIGTREITIRDFSFQPLR